MRPTRWRLLREALPRPRAPSTSQYMMFICYKAAARNVVIPDSAANVKQITTVSYAGVVAYPVTTTQYGSSSSALHLGGYHSVSSVDGTSAFWMCVWRRTRGC